ncbi:hypothetical protein TVAG_394390 [Trichomonas vaginalis G3]|uniref:Secreted protein n=1 Tax=Trichomonas vaginalis (strain ATCC PRA-98 / G3) TaxID=412133 RepID=A2DWF5_TRIV3|nr:hypothetical protein TVAGG3_0428570 [Trichomonas vaginalis G3]EAY15295.1 hypothetical protein TVAG_394390 [Trichomonas vaginalis G3]KAI5536593.1 hypothetical protein TVAGG3_0428570 [Trichomonas vaginalis G3]|eukprot:XP_001327518.1 hypothetical protein [Trichomonas vaginalis G3]
MFLLLLACVLMFRYYPRRSHNGFGFMDDNQLTCVKSCMEGTRGRLTVEKRLRCGNMCKNRLGLPSENDNDDTNTI